MLHSTLACGDVESLATSPQVVANKGGLACKIRIRGTTLCFVSCHLQAHEGAEHLARRNASCAEILSGARLGKNKKVIACILMVRVEDAPDVQPKSLV